MNQIWCRRDVDDDEYENQRDLIVPDPESNELDNDEDIYDDYEDSERPRRIA
jgi:hypothetical protein